MNEGKMHINKFLLAVWYFYIVAYILFLILLIYGTETEDNKRIGILGSIFIAGLFIGFFYVSIQIFRVLIRTVKVFIWGYCRCRICGSDEMTPIEKIFGNLEPKCQCRAKMIKVKENVQVKKREAKHSEEEAEDMLFSSGIEPTYEGFWAK